MGQGIKRRDFLRIAGAGTATAALVGCGEEPPEKLIPYLVPPEDVIPGIATWYATVCRECPAGCGMVVRTREGRAVKAEGNAFHPVNRGKLCARGQASLQGLYNPDRIRSPLFRKDGRFHPVSWQEAEARVAQAIAELLEEGRPDAIALVTAALGGTLEQLERAWMAALGSQRRIVYEPFSYEWLRSANAVTFGRNEIPIFDIEKSRFIVAFGADFLETWLSPVAFARGFSSMRSFDRGRMGGFAYIGPRLSMTAANADDWFAARPGTEVFVALGMLHVILAEHLESGLPRGERGELARLVQPYTPDRVAELTEVPPNDIFRLAETFARETPSIALGPGIGTASSNAMQTAIAINLLNYAAGDVGKTVHYGSGAAEPGLSTYDQVLELAEDMKRGKVSILLFHGANPVFSLPQSVEFRSALENVPLVVSLSTYADETTALSDIVLPSHSFLESWGDYAPSPGVYGLMQPVMKPLFDTQALGDTLLSVARRAGLDAVEFQQASFYGYLRDRWSILHEELAPDVPFEVFWEKALGQGGVWQKPVSEEVQLSPEVFRTSFTPRSRSDGEASSLYLHLYPSLRLYDGRQANRSWLQELPDPMTKIVWDNWAEINRQTAATLGVSEGDVVRLESSDGAIDIPVHASDHVRADVVAIPLGQGHWDFGRFAEDRGPNPLDLLPPDSQASGRGIPYGEIRVRIARTGKHHPLVSTAGSDYQGHREIAQAIPLAELKANDRLIAERQVPQMYAAHDHPQHRWGMAVDLNACIGCSACTVACYAENNIAIVGKKNVAEGRDMAWLQVQRYFEPRAGKPDVRFVPMLCQQCDSAPCEPVCPVYATYHNPEGLNAQVYNRCVGTRYCSNNCPYKVRHFNWFDYEWPDPLQLQLNPDVSVRSKGVMEKCTFCVQRIREAKDRAKDENRSLQDGAIVPACAQTCPTEAIVFGDLKDPESRVSKLARDPRRYRVLEELNTQPAVTYLKKIRNDGGEA